MVVNNGDNALQDTGVGEELGIPDLQHRKPDCHRLILGLGIMIISLVSCNGRSIIEEGMVERYFEYGVLRDCGIYH